MLQGQDALFRVQAVGGADVHHIDPRHLFQHGAHVLEERHIEAGDTRLFLGPDIAQGHKFGLGMAMHHLRMPLADVATTDHGDLDRTCHASLRTVPFFSS